MSKKLLALLLAVVMVVGAIPVAAVAAGEGITITVGEEKSLVDAIGEANGTAAEAGPVTVVIPEGTFGPDANEQMEITRDNVVIRGAGQDKTIIDCGEFSCDGQAGIAVDAHNVTLKDLTVTSAAASGDVSAIKVSDLAAIPAEGSMVLLTGCRIENVTVSSVKGHGINLHGVDGCIVTNVTATSVGKCGISLANAKNVTVSGSELTGKSLSWGDIGLQYAENAAYYSNPCSLTLGDGNTYGLGLIKATNPADVVTLAADCTAMIAGAKVVDGENTVTIPESYAAVKRTTTGGDYYTMDFEWGGVKYSALAQALAAAVTGDTITLLGDIEVTQDAAYEISVTDKAVNIDGNGHKITQAADCDISHALLYFQDTGAAVTVKNLIFDGIRGGAAIWALNADISVDNCVFQNGNHTQTQGLVRTTASDATIQNCTFDNNSCNMVVSFNYDMEASEISDDDLIIDKCTFINNTCKDTAVVYYVKGTSSAITSNAFTDNTVNSASHGSVLYYSEGANGTVTGNVFTGNTITAADVRAGVLALEAGTVASENVFTGNTISSTAEETTYVATVLNKADGDSDGVIISGNYWGDANKPDANDHTSVKGAPTTIKSYYASYVDGELGDLVQIVEAKIGDNYYASLEEAYAAEGAFTSGYFTVDPSAYCAEGLTGVANTGDNKTEYPWTVGTKGENAATAITDIEASVQPPALPETATEAEEMAADEISQFIAAPEASGVPMYQPASISGAAVDLAIASEANGNTITVPEALEAVKAIDSGATEVTVVVQPYKEIQITDISLGEGGFVESITLDITPMIRTVATTLSESRIENGEEIITVGMSANAVQIGTAQKLEITGEVLVEFSVPHECLGEGVTSVYVKHDHNGVIHTYLASVTPDEYGVFDVVSFTNPNGFSEFTLLSSYDPAAKIGEEYYATLAEAVAAVQEGDTITLLKDNDETGITVSRELCFSVDSTGYSFNALAAITGGTFYNRTVTGSPIPGQEYVCMYDFTFTPPYIPPVEEPEEPEEEKPCDGGDDCVSKAYDDLISTEWYHEAADYVLTNGLMQGVSLEPKLFDPYGDLSRGMLFQLLYNLEGKPAVIGTAPFTDVDADDWYYSAVIWAWENQLVQGNGDGTCAPEEAITRQEMVTLLYRYAKLKGYDVSIGEDTNILSYEDAFEISEWAIEAFQWACGAGMASGDGGYLYPADSAERVEVAQLIMNFLEKAAK